MTENNIYELYLRFFSVIKKIFFIILFIISSQSLNTAPRGVLNTPDVAVFFDEQLSPAARKILKIYPILKSELEETLGWKMNFKPLILLVKERKKFQKMAGNDLFVAFAVPRKKQIVMDYSRLQKNPYTFEITLKHELCHLLVHHYIQTVHLPKWLDEGIAQWVSDGFSELMIDKKRSFLNEAVLSEKYLSLNSLTYRFPRDPVFLTLAYEQSKSMVAYIKEEFGKDKILMILEGLKSGNEADSVILQTLSLSINQLEQNWHDDLRKKRSGFVYLASNLYEILFFFAALTAIYGFIKLIIKKRTYNDDEIEFDSQQISDQDDDPPFSH